MKRKNLFEQENTVTNQKKKPVSIKFEDYLFDESSFCSKNDKKEITENLAKDLNSHIKKDSIIFLIYLIIKNRGY